MRAYLYQYSIQDLTKKVLLIQQYYFSKAPLFIQQQRGKKLGQLSSGRKVAKSVQSSPSSQGHLSEELISFEYLIRTYIKSSRCYNETIRNLQSVCRCFSTYMMVVHFSWGNQSLKPPRLGSSQTSLLNNLRRINQQ